MLYLFLHWLESYNICIPHVFYYTTFRMLFSAITSFLFTLAVGKVFIAKLVSLKVGHKVRVADVAVLAGNYDKEKEIPSMGGLLFITSMLLSQLLWMDTGSPFTFLFSFSLLSMGCIGFIDDYCKMKGIGISARLKFFLQGLSMLLIVIYLHSEGVFSAMNQIIHFTQQGIKIGEVVGPFPLSMKYLFIPFFKHPIVFSSSLFLLPFSLFVLIGSCNAVNLTDGLDGLATGCMLLVAAVFALIAFVSNHYIVADYLNILYIEGAGQIAIFLSSMIGALLGFLWFNSYPAQLFMGDTGSLALGGSIALAAILLRRECLFAIVGGIFVLETLSVILQVFWVRCFKKRLFLCSPIHHHFQIKGWHESKIVIRFWMIGLILALIGLLSLKIQ